MGESSFFLFVCVLPWNRIICVALVGIVLRLSSPLLIYKVEMDAS